jgi:cell filamentation protein
LEDAETKTLTAGFTRLLGMYGPAHRFTSADISMIHKILLSGTCKWDGRYRQVDVTNGEISFASPKQIPRLMEAFEKGSLHRNTPCKFKSVDRVIKALAEVHVELILIHPYPEGNGRTARVLASLMAAQAGLSPLDFKDMEGKWRDEYMSAIHRGLYGDYKPMEELFAQLILKSTKAAKRWGK